MATDQPARTPITILDEFLTLEEWRNLMEFTLGHAGDFQHARVLGSHGNDLLDASYRRSRVLFDMGPFYWLFAQRLMTFLPHVLLRLALPGFPVTQLEVQLTASNAGEFFRLHTDNDSVNVIGRHVTYVYFFYREPCGFFGGALRIFDTAFHNGHAVAEGPYREVLPQQNQLVCFPSSTLHEILPVACPSGDFADSRFTVNGWFHR